MNNEIPMGRDITVVPENIAAIRRILDENDLVGHAHAAPDYDVISQDTSAPVYERRSVAACESARKAGHVVTARLVTY